MRFGLFGGATAGKLKEGADSQFYNDYIDYVCEAEQLGFHSVFLVEHHFTGIGQVSASLNLLTYLAAKTSKLRLGTAVIVLPWHNPVLLAEQAATLDLLSNGRFDFGIGRGYRYNEFNGFGMSMEEANELYAESVEVLKKSWTSKGRFSHKGKRWTFNDIVVEPPTTQKPHPPLWIGAASDASITKAGEDGFHLLLDQFASVENAGKRIATYRQAIESKGHKFNPHHVGLTRALHLAMNKDEREEQIRQRAAFVMAAGALAANPNAPPAGPGVPTSLEGVRKATEESGIIGPPEEMITRLKALQAVGIEYVLLMDVSGSRKTLRTFAKEVMPAFKN